MNRGLVKCLISSSEFKYMNIAQAASLGVVAPTDFNKEPIMVHYDIYQLYVYLTDVEADIRPPNVYTATFQFVIRYGLHNRSWYDCKIPYRIKSSHEYYRNKISEYMKSDQCKDLVKKGTKAYDIAMDCVKRIKTCV